MMSNHALDQRRAGVILHPTSLPGSPGNGDLGPHAYHFVDFLAAAGVSVWQMLPTGQTQDDGSPYQCLSVNAGNRWLISIELLQQWGWLKQAAETDQFNSTHAYRAAMLKQAWTEFQIRDNQKEHAELREFIEQQHTWLRDFALYWAIKQEYRGLSWNNWPDALKKRHPSALRHARGHQASRIQQVYFEQFVFNKQWQALKRYANAKGVYLFGDIPIFVAYDSADVWANRNYFKLDAEGQLQVVSGVPPDYFSETGQRWGNPCYDWHALQGDGFKWWRQRLAQQLVWFDLIRIDHFRGFESYWEIPADSETAQQGSWVPALGKELFTALQKTYRELPVVAEDLGIITDAVIALRDAFHFPGMKVFQFGFDGDPQNPHLLHNHLANCVVYTGTHDNDTTAGWFHNLQPVAKQQVLEYLGQGSAEIPWSIIRAVLCSVAKLAVVPMQDLLGLGSEHRMNQPGTVEGNWHWRFEWSQVDEHLAGRFRQLVNIYGRLASSGEA